MSLLVLRVLYMVFSTAAGRRDESPPPKQQSEELVGQASA
jgi:hypothetical protein